METTTEQNRSTSKSSDKMFTLKKWNAVAMWSWDVECDTCAICRVQVMGECQNRGKNVQYPSVIISPLLLFCDLQS